MPPTIESRNVPPWNEYRAIEACFRGHRTAVFVCRCMANLYSSPRSSTRVAPAAPCAEWALAYTGVPVLLLDGGNTKSRLKRQIQVGWPPAASAGRRTFRLIQFLGSST